MQSNSRSAIINILIFLFAVSAGIFSMDFNEERAPSIVVLSICFVTGILWVRAITQDHEFEWFTRIFCLALALRVVISFVIHTYIPPGTFAEDDYLYDEMGWRIAKIWEGEYQGDPRYGIGTSGFMRAQEAREMGYAYVVAFFYYLFGRASLVPKIFNCFVGTMTVIYLTRLSWTILGKRVGSLTGVLCSLFPSMVLWSGLALKDAIATFCVVYVVWHSYRVSHRLRPIAMLKIGVAMFILGQMRGYMFALLAGCIAMGFFFRSTKHLLRNYILGFFIVLAGFYMLQTFGFGKSYLSQASFEQMDQYRRSLATGNSAIHVDADISSPTKAMAYLPIGIAYFLFGPFPWSVNSGRQLVALPEVLAWYCLFFFFLRGLYRAVRGHFPDLASTISVMLLVTVTYSLVEGNLGTAYRHRSQIFGFYLLFTALGLFRRETLQREVVRSEPSKAQRRLQKSPQLVPRSEPGIVD